MQSSLNEPAVIADQATYTDLTNAIADKNLVGWPHGPCTSVYYEATSTEEEQTYYTYGAFGFTTEATPGFSGNNTYHPPYQAVVDNYYGIGQYPGATIRALLAHVHRLGEPGAALAARRHGAARGDADDRKDFTIDTSPTVWVTGGPTEVHSYPVHLRYSMTVPASGKFDWHVNPSLRPSQYTSDFVRSPTRSPAARRRHAAGDQQGDARPRADGEHVAMHAGLGRRHGARDARARRSARPRASGRSRRPPQTYDRQTHGERDEHRG